MPPSGLHEGLLELVRSQPTLAADLLAGPLGVDLPPYAHARVESGELTELVPTEWRADAVVVLTDHANAPVLAVVVEVQLTRDTGKRYSWPVYIANLRGRLRCPVVLFVICAEAAVATWSATPIKLGPGTGVITPLVLGPSQVPVVTDPDQALRAPELAVLSAIAHHDQEKTLSALLAALSAVDDAHAALYHDAVLAALPEVARHLLEELMTTGTYEYQSDFVRRYIHQGRSEGRAEGRAEGEAKAILAILAARGINVPDHARARITECTDLDQLETWIHRAATANSINDLFV